MNAVQLIDISRLDLVLGKVFGIKTFRKFIRKEKICSKFSFDFVFKSFTIWQAFANGVRIITDN